MSVTNKLQIMLDDEQEAHFKEIMELSGLKKRSDAGRHIFEIFREVYRFYEVRGITDLNEIKDCVSKELGRRQLQIPFDKFE